MNKFSLFDKSENCVEVTAELLTMLKLQVTRTSLEKDLTNHPDYPSLLSIADVLALYGVENISIISTMEKLSEAPFPCIVPIKSATNGDNFFTIISAVKDNLVHYYDPKKSRWGNTNYETFREKWPSGIVLLVDAEGAFNETDYVIKRRKEKQLNAGRYSTWLTLPVFALTYCLYYLFRDGHTALFSSGFFLSSLLGCAVCSLLLWYEFDSYNPILQQICSTGKKVNCSAILNSSASKIGNISWSSIGFIYFSGALFTQLMTGIENAYSLFTLASFNTFAVPYVVFSIYYQWRIAKQWCLMCLTVQALLILQFSLSLFAHWHTAISIGKVLNVQLIFPVIFSYLVPIVSLSLLLAQLRSAKEGKSHKVDLQRLKHNRHVFEVLLQKQPVITESVKDLGIILGNPDALYTVIKVCNPYCKPCSKSHRQIENLLRINPDVKIQIIYTANSDERDMTGTPVKHFLALAETNQEDLVRAALNDWYSADEKDYAAFADKYPINDDLKKQNTKVNAMRKWCDATHVAFTPTFFISVPFESGGSKSKEIYQLPDLYTISDLSYFLFN